MAVQNLFGANDEKILRSWGIYDQLINSLPQEFIDLAKSAYRIAHNITRSLPIKQSLVITLKKELLLTKSLRKLVGPLIRPDTEEEVAESIARFVLDNKWQEISNNP